MVTLNPCNLTRWSTRVNQLRCRLRSMRFKSEWRQPQFSYACQHHRHFMRGVAGHVPRSVRHETRRCEEIQAWSSVELGCVGIAAPVVNQGCGRCQRTNSHATIHYESKHCQECFNTYASYQMYGQCLLHQFAVNMCLRGCHSCLGTNSGRARARLGLHAAVCITLV
jgi:hypothetical protein